MNATNAEHSSVEEQIAHVVQRALERELSHRLDLEPHVQLGVPRRAPRATIDEAYRALAKQYDPIDFASYGRAVATVAAKISALLTDAHVRLTSNEDAREVSVPSPAARRRDDTQRALETLKGTIARRVAEAEELARAGRLVEAIGALESVILVDRRNDDARRRLSELRERLQMLTPKQPFFRRLLARLFPAR